MSIDLPLTNFEQLMLHKDSSAYPSSCFTRLRFRGQLNRAAFETAARRVTARHPLLHSTVAKTKRGYVWKLADVNPDIVWSEDLNLQEPPIQRQDLQYRCGWSWAVVVGADVSMLRVQFHHACCDGLAAYRVIHELLIVYAAAVTQNKPNAFLADLPELDESLLQSRADLRLRGRELLKVLLQQTVGLLGVLQYVVRKPVPLLRHRPVERDCSTPDAYPSLLSIHFDKSVSTKFRNAVSSEFTTNDVLTALLFEALHAFRKEGRQPDRNSWLRLMIPLSLRQREHHACSAANVVSSVFIDRRGKDIEDPAALQHSIVAEFHCIKRFRLGYTFVFSLMAARLLPNGLKQTAEPKQCNTSAVFTNLGRVFKRSPLPQVDGRLQCGDVVLEATEPAAPIARNVNAAFSASWYAGRLSITLHYDPRVINTNSAPRLRDLFVSRIESYASGGQSSAPKP